MTTLTALAHQSASQASAPESLAPNIAHALEETRAAQATWARTPLKHRLKIIRSIRHRLAQQASRFGKLLADICPRSAAESMVCEVLPLAESCRFLERAAPRLLKPQRPPLRWRPIWLSGTSLRIVRDPLGVVLIIAPGNYPLMLSGIHTIQALCAGNAVLLKPSAEGTKLTTLFAETLKNAGLPDHLLQILPEDPAFTTEAINQGVDKIILTGSTATGKAVLKSAANTLTPVVAELSGCDAAIIREDADLDLATDAIHFGLTFNAGESCIAPRRILVHRAVAGRFETKLLDRLRTAPSIPLPPKLTDPIQTAVNDAVANGAHLVHGQFHHPPTGPIVVADARPNMTIMNEGFFAPVMAITTVESDEHAAGIANDCPSALGATIFSNNRQAAHQLAKQLHVGCVVINDMIVPTADPRLPFGGRKQSGFGITRGAEGLLEMTCVKAIVRRSGKRRPHLSPLDPDSTDTVASLIAGAHSQGLMTKLGHLIKAVRQRKKQR